MPAQTSPANANLALAAVGRLRKLISSGMDRDQLAAALDSFEAGLLSLRGGGGQASRQAELAGERCLKCGHVGLKALGGIGKCRSCGTLFDSIRKIPPPPSPAKTASAVGPPGWITSPRPLNAQSCGEVFKVED